MKKAREVIERDEDLKYRAFCWGEARKLLAELRKKKKVRKEEWRHFEKEKESSEELGDLTVKREPKKKTKLTYDEIEKKQETGTIIVDKFVPKKRICESCFRELRSNIFTTCPDCNGRPIVVDDLPEGID